MDTAERPGEAEPRRLISLRAACEYAGISKSLGYEMAAAGRFPGLVKIDGHRMLVRRAALDRWLEGQSD